MSCQNFFVKHFKIVKVWKIFQKSPTDVANHVILLTRTWDNTLKNWFLPMLCNWYDTWILPKLWIRTNRVIGLIKNIKFNFPKASKLTQRIETRPYQTPLTKKKKNILRMTDRFVLSYIYNRLFMWWN